MAAFAAAKSREDAVGRQCGINGLRRVLNGAGRKFQRKF
jgi:hypothetical protein